VAETRKRWTGYGRGAGVPSTHSAHFRAAHKASARGHADEPESTEVEVVTIETVSGTRRVWVDRVNEYEEVLEP
jgi:hypothetical protein